MSHTNSTPNYGLPQFVTGDKPAWLVDVNQGYSAIDTAIKNAADAAATAGTNATQALNDAAAASASATNADNKASGATASIADTFDSTATYEIADLVMYNNLLYQCMVAVTTPGPWTGTTNWTRRTIEEITPLEAQDLPYTLGSGQTVKGFLDDLNTNKLGKSDPIDEITLNVGTYGGNIKARKYGRVVNITGYGIGSITTVPQNAAYTFGTLPERFRPAYQMHMMGFASSNTYKYDAGQGFRINTDGTIVAYVYSGTTMNNGCFNFSYIV